MIEIRWTESEPSSASDGTLVRVWRSEKVAHDLVDGKGREIGGFIIIEERDEFAMVPTADGRGRTSQKTGRRVFWVETYATRDGRQFGAIPRAAKRETLEEAKAQGVKALEGQRRRYERAVAKGVGRQFRARGQS